MGDTLDGFIMSLLISTVFISTGALFLAQMISVDEDGRPLHVGVWSRMYALAATIWAVVLWLV
ncbi:hypothetical protein [Aurantimonas marina]|uniref:hypothetical protein n=1 Tax=Aurantimonas marina TaxID=2780508 RepID=UPI0019D260A6|nr:hypothetical protein [Aurantimonas marina]